MGPFIFLFLNVHLKVAFGKESAEQLRVTLSSSSAPIGSWTIAGLSGPSKKLLRKFVLGVSIAMKKKQKTLEQF